MTKQEHEAELDDRMVDQLAVAMKAKLAKKRADGYGGWVNADVGHLARLLVEHVRKGDPVDIANFAGMLFVLSEAVGQDGVRVALTSAMSDLVEKATAGLGIRENY